MKFPSPLIRGQLIQRYKRFLADVQLPDGAIVTAHVPNSGSMMGLRDAGIPVYISRSDNPTRKLPFTLELVEVGGVLVGVNTAHPNAIVAEAIAAGKVPTLTGYDRVRREVAYGKNSRVDILLEAQDKPPVYVEVKNVTLCRTPQIAEFPDAVTARGTKHLEELSIMVNNGARAVMVYLVQRADCDTFSLAADIDPAYAVAFAAARRQGVEVICLACAITQQAIEIERILPIGQGDEGPL